MATELLLVKQAGGLVPADELAAQCIARWKLGSVIKGVFTRKRNGNRHRKFFLMLDHAFDHWEAPEIRHRGERAVKNLERFRKDILILAGYYEVVVNLKGEVRYEAKSMSYDAMDDDEFEACYRRCAEVCLQKVLHNYTMADLEQVVERLMELT